MDNANENPRRKVNNTSRAKSPVMWVIGAVFLVALLGVIFFYDGRNTSTVSSGANPPNVVTGSQSK